MRNYEVTFIVDPVLSGDEIKATAQTYVKHLEKEGCKITHFDEMGLLQLAYPINRRTSGIYFCVEFEVETGALIDNLELAFRRDQITGTSHWASIGCLSDSANFLTIISRKSVSLASMSLPSTQAFNASIASFPPNATSPSTAA